MDWEKNKIVRVSKNSGPVLSHLWTKVHEILGQRRRPFALSKLSTDYLCHVSFSRYSPLSPEVVETEQNVKAFSPQCFWRDDPNFSTAYCWRDLPSTVWQSLVEFRLLNADLRLRSLATKWNAEFTEGGWKLTSNLKPFEEQSSRCFEMM